jgi:hypothetical protein
MTKQRSNKVLPGLNWSLKNNETQLFTADVNEAAKFICSKLQAIESNTFFALVGAGISTSRGLMVISKFKLQLTRARISAEKMGSTPLLLASTVLKI